MTGITASPAIETEGPDAETPKIGIGMLGYGFMGRAHSSALRAVAHLPTPRSLRPELVCIAGRNERAVTAAAATYGFGEYVTDWRAVIADPRIGLFDNTGPNSVHAEPTIAAAEAGKHVLCEKPLGRDADEAHRMWQRVAATGVKHMCAFNYRFVPAVRLARQLIKAGDLGQIVHFRGTYLQDWLIDDTIAGLWRLDKTAAGSGALGDLGAHVIDLARYLVGEIEDVSGALRIFTPIRGGVEVDVDDAFVATVSFAGGALGTIEASRFCPGRKNAFRFEVNGTGGSLAFDLERLNELQLSQGRGGFRKVLVSEPHDPWWDNWWPAGHMLGWEHTFIHELDHLLDAIRYNRDVAPVGATFEDGYRASQVCDAIVDSARDRNITSVRYRRLSPPNASL